MIRTSVPIKVGDYDVLDTGSVIGIEGQPIDLAIIESNGFTLRLTFKRDSSEAGTNIQATRFGTNGIEFTFLNFSGLSQGSIEPILFGHYEGRQLFLLYRIHSLEKGGKQVDYTLLLGKPHVEDGQ